ncbi:MAG: hypothetical protein E7393_04490 [Ruminococcaceae bacterium]|nr:hypothetical protein [Oscillospiraceae bacterium]
MIIQKIEIEQFGGLQNYTLQLTPGFQYIYGHNEAGKSTLCAFISAMFYGMPAKVRGVGLRGDSRQLYMPWGESYMAGSIHFAHDGYEYVLKRRFGRSSRGDRANLYRASDWQEIAVDMESIGQQFFGIGEEAFNKTLFISQSGAAFSKGREDELMVRLSNLERTGEEDASLQKAITELQKAEYELISKTGRGGAVAQLDSDIEVLRAELFSAKQTHTAFQSVLEEIQNLTEEKEKGELDIAVLNQQHADALAFEQYELREKDRENQKKLLNCLTMERNSLKQAEQALSAIEKEEKNLAFVQTLSPDIVLTIAEKEAACSVLEEKERMRQALVEEIEELNEITKKMPAKSVKPISIRMFIAMLLVVLAIAGGLLIYPLFFLLFIPAVFLMYPIILHGIQHKQKENQNNLIINLEEKRKQLSALEATHVTEQISHLRGEIQEVLSAAGVDTLAALSEKKEKAQTVSHQAESLRKDVKRIADNIQNYEAMLDSLFVPQNEEPLSYTGPNAETIEKQLNVIKEKQLDRERTLAHLQARVEQGYVSGRSVSVIETELRAAEQRKEELLQIHQEIVLAREALEACNEELKSSFAPVLNEKSGDIIKQLTKGRYHEIKITDTYSMMLKTPSGHDIVEADFVSAGTCDLLYFALRLAVLQTLYDAIPLLVMDDTFIQMDEERQQEAFSLLAEKPAEQILYFSCHRPKTDWSIETVVELPNA